jgi:diaminopimelate decarboxylase
MENKTLLELAGKRGTPLFVYDREMIVKNYENFIRSFPYENKRVLYSVMANYNPAILRVLKSEGCGAHVQSVYALRYVLENGFEKEDISFTSSGTKRDGIEKLHAEGIRMNFESVGEIEDCGKTIEKYGKNGVVNGLRIHTGDIHVEGNVTNRGNESNIGIYPEDVNKAVSIAQSFGIKIGGVHGYLASNVSDARYFKALADYLCEMSLMLEVPEYVNFGGGFGNELDLNEVGPYYSSKMQGLSEERGKMLRMEIEPGRRLAGSAGVLLAEVTRVKQLRNGKKLLYVDAGFGEFARPYVYGPDAGFHEIYALSDESKTEKYDVRASTVLQTDVLGVDRFLPETKPGDIIAIRNAGAYAMASGFPNPKPKAKHVIV